MYWKPLSSCSFDLIVVVNYFAMKYKKIGNRLCLLPETDEEVAIKKSWGHRWGAFSMIEARGKNIVILTATIKGKVVYCSDAPIGTAEDYIGFIKRKGLPPMVVSASVVNRKQLMEKKLYYIPKYDSIINELLRSMDAVYEPIGLVE